ncbi:MAG: hypothetical protein U9N59_16450, partial [Campylobacterota bacterium]|nr:hypothetical protein [Campylobacterota bacterium]
MKLKLLLILLFLQISIYANKIGNPFAQTGHTSNINMLSVTSDEKYLISSDDKNIIIWDYKKEMVIKRILLETYLPKLENGLKVRFKLKLLNSNNILIEWSDWKNDDTFYKSVEVDIVTEKVVKEYPMSSNSNIIDNKDIKDIDRMMNNIKSNIPLSAHDLEKDETIRNIKITSKKTSPNQKYVIYAISETKMFTSTVAKKNISYTQLYLWNINTKQLIKTYKKYAEKIEKIVFTKDSKYFYTIGHSWNKFNRNKNKNGHIAKWSLKSNTPISTLITNSDKISDLYITEDSKNIFVSTFRNVINVWNVSNNKKLNSISILGVKKIFQNSFDDNSLFFVNFENRIQLYDIKKQKVLKEFKANNVKSGYDQFNNLIYNKNGPFTRFDAKIFNQLPLLKGRQHVLNENANYTLTFEKKYNPNTSSVEKKYYIYNLNNLNEIYTLNRESSSFDNISNNGLVARIDDSEIILVNPKTKNKNKINLKNYLNYDFSLESIQFSKNGKKLYIFINTSDNKILKSSDDFAWIMYSFDLDSFQLKQEKYIPKDLGFINNFYEEKSLVLSWKFLYNIKRDTYFKFDKDGTLSNKGNFLLLNVLEKGQQYLYLYNLINSQIVQKFNIQNLDFKGWHENYNEENSFIVLENDNNRRLDYYDISSGKHILSVYLFRHSDSIIARNLNVSESLNSILDKYNKSHVEWLAITPEGFFDASKNGAKYLNVSTGPMTVSSIDKFYDTFYRPDLIQKVLNGKNISQYAKAGSLKKIIDRDSSAPTVSIKNSVKYSQNRDFTLNLEICENDKGSYNNLTLYLNGMTVDFISKDRALKLKKQNRTRKECFTIDKLISLSNGTNTIGFKATNKAGTIESNLDEIVVNYKGRSNSKPNLHILAIGVDKYRDGDLWLK